MRGKQNRAMIISAQTMGWDPNVIQDQNMHNTLPDVYIGGMINLRVDGREQSPEGMDSITNYDPGHPSPSPPPVVGAPQNTSKRSKSPHMEIAES